MRCLFCCIFPTRSLEEALHRDGALHRGCWPVPEPQGCVGGWQRGRGAQCVLPCLAGPCPSSWVGLLTP